MHALMKGLLAQAATKQSSIKFLIVVYDAPLHQVIYLTAVPTMRTILWFQKTPITSNYFPTRIRECSLHRLKYRYCINYFNVHGTVHR